MRRLLLWGSILFFLFYSNLHAEVLYVDVGGITGWSGACTDLQAATDAVENVDEVWVAKGTYYPSSQPTEIDTSDTRYNHFALKDSVAVYGGFDGSETVLDDRDITANETILSGDIDDNGTLDDGNAYHVFYHPASLALTSDAVLSGFTITGGYADGSDPHNFGGGMSSYTGGMFCADISMNV